MGTNPAEVRDYYEPRQEGRFYNVPKAAYGVVNASTNYNSMLAFDFGGRFVTRSSIQNHSHGYYINPILRFSDKWSMKITHAWDEYLNDRGFACFDTVGASIFGMRNIVTIENTVTTRYLFKNDMALSVTARHYWSRGEYQQYFNLNNDGTLQSTMYPGNSNFNTNFFNVDLSYSWQFSPGSSLIITYKNQVIRDPYPVDGNELHEDYRHNLDLTMRYPQSNSLSLKVLYYLDYQYFKKKSA